ncbi:MAG: amidohydrolase family protein [Acidimicrobiia bacterium]
MIVDFRVSAPTPKGLAPILGRTDRLAGYREVYAKSYRDVSTELYMAPDRFVEHLDEVGVDHAVLFTANSLAVGLSYPNDELAEFVQARPDRMSALAGIDPRTGKAAVAEVERAVTELGFVGVTMGPWTHRMATDDRAYYPIYAKCSELGVPVVLHCSISFDRGALLDDEHPRRIDQIAVDFPDLKIVASHAGWPWVLELVAVAWRHPTVMIELSAINPRHLATENSGYGPLLQYGNTLLQDRVMWGSAWPAISMTDSMAAVRDLPLKPEVVDKWLGDNAQRFLGL